MNIALIGYGKMGKMVESIAIERGHQIILRIDIDNLYDFSVENLNKADVVIEFTNPEMAFENVTRCIEYGVPVVSGSTGWYKRMEEAQNICIAKNGTMLCTSNFSLGVNIFFEVNRYLAKLMNHFPNKYNIEIEETHHTQKLDAPSGTAITLAEEIINEIACFGKWELEQTGSPNNATSLPIRAIRRENVPGTHHVKYMSDVDDIEIIHTAHNRKGLALGAILAAEYICDKKGIFEMRDVLKINE